jgi:arginyl-tRNA synthetase
MLAQPFRPIRAGNSGHCSAAATLPRVITGDLDQALATTVTSAGTWRPALAGTARGPRTYATTIAFRLVGVHTGGPDGPRAVAAGLAARLRGLSWVEAATVAGEGYLVVTVTADALACLAVRITEAGPTCDHSSALAGTGLTAPAAVGLASARTWEEARQRVHAAVTGRLAEAAGAHVKTQDDAERIAAPDSPAGVGATSVVAEAIAYAGADAVTYALARLPPRGPVRLDAHLAAAHHLGNPAYAVRYAHAHAASTLRQAADLGLGLGEAARFQPRLLTHPSEQALLHELSWLPERVAGAARRRRPDAFAHYLEGLAGAYFDCQEACPAVPPGTGRSGTGLSGTGLSGTGLSGTGLPGTALPGTGPPATARPGEPAAGAGPARLWLVAAARTALRAGLDRLGVAAPDRL